MYTGLVLSGGSLKGMAFIGCVQCLEEKTWMKHIRIFIGTSFGAIVALLCTLGLSSQVMESTLIEALSNYPRRSLDADQCLSAFCTLGLDDGSYIEHAIRDILNTHMHQPDATFMELAKKTGKHLVITAANISTCETEYFDVDHSPHMSVIQAIRASISIPIIFTPVTIQGDLYVDGGLFDNLPINYIETHKHLNKNLKDVLAISIHTEEKEKMVHPPDLLGYMRMLLNAMVVKLNERSPRTDKYTVVKLSFDDAAFLDEFSIETMSFTLKGDRIKRWIQKGYMALLESVA